MSVSFSIVDKNHDRLVFDVINGDVAFLNAIRRTILADIENVAIGHDPHDTDVSTVLFKENTSSLHNEFLAHRLSMIPVCMTKDEIDMNIHDQYTFELRARNTGSDVLHVKSNAIQVIDLNGKSHPELAARWFPMDHITNDWILITSLKPNPYMPAQGESLDVTCKCKKGTAHGNIMYACASVASYVNKIDPDLRASKLTAFLEAKGASGDNKDLVRLFDSLEAQRCFKTNNHGEPADFTFFIETTCALQPDVIFSMAIEVLRRRVSTLHERVERVHRRDGEISEIYIRDEGHTLGNLFQSVCYKTLFGTDVSFVGYNVPHPLESTLCLVLGHKGDPLPILKKTQSAIKDTLDAMLTKWNAMFTVAPPPPKKAPRKPRGASKSESTA